MITLSKVSKLPQRSGAEALLDGGRQGRSRGRVRSVGLWQVDAHQMRNGLEPFQEGAITVAGISVSDRKTDLPKLRAGIGMVFQHFELFPPLTVMRHLE
jgi:predicted ABC-type transport system involved in lysophospholipase L1 biosynthesis ATPase subunit